MGLSKLPGGLLVGGVPVGIPDLPALARGYNGGRVRYVGNRTGLQAGDGKSIDRPYATLSVALDELNNDANSYGDLIIVHAGHTESVSSVDWASNLGNKNLSIVGLGTGTLRPKFTWTAAAATFLLDYEGTELCNLQLLLAGASSTGALTVAAAMTVSQPGCRIAGCYIQTGWDSDSIVAIGIDVTDSADDFEFVGNEMAGAAAAVPTTAPLRIAGSDRCKILSNIFHCPSASGVGVIKFIATAPVDVNVTGNHIHNNAASSTLCITQVANMTGVIADNRLRNMTDANNGQLGSGGSLQYFQNYGVNNNAETGILLGTPSV